MTYLEFIQAHPQLHLPEDPTELTQDQLRLLEEWKERKEGEDDEVLLSGRG